MTMTILPGSVTDEPGTAAWASMMATATAVPDRLLHGGHVPDIRGRSYRLKDLEEDLRKRRESERDKPADNGVAQCEGAP